MIPDPGGDSKDQIGVHKLNSGHSRHVAVIGGGINGVMSAWALARRGHHVTLFERDRLMAHTSSASTKLLHGGLRYLENGEFRLVREALRERAWWIAQAPHLAHPIELLLPVSERGRPAWLIRAGLMLYDLLAGRSNLGRHRRLDAAEARRLAPEINPYRLTRGAFMFTDGQMDDRALGLWAADRAREAGVEIIEGTEIRRLEVDGTLHTAAGAERFDAIANVAGPWAQALLERSGLSSRLKLDLVRGSHLVIEAPVSVGCLMEVANERRILFALPWNGHTLLGTTEARQTLDAPVECTRQERDYLLQAWHDYYHLPTHVMTSFAGIRPLIKSARVPNRTTREYATEVHQRIITVFGGKWTTSRCLGERVANVVEAQLR